MCLHCCKQHGQGASPGAQVGFSGAIQPHPACRRLTSALLAHCTACTLHCLGGAAAPPEHCSKGASPGAQVVCKGHKGDGHGVYAAKCEGKTTTIEKDGAVVSVCEGLFKNFGKVAKAINGTDKEFRVGHLTGQRLSEAQFCSSFALLPAVMTRH